MDTRRALDTALADLGDRWSLLVVASLLDGPRRFGDLESDLEGIAPNVLTRRLRHLREAGVVVARPYQERPRRFEYLLSDRGRALAGPVGALAAWGDRRRGGAGGPRHDACGTALQPTWWCPTCDTAVTGDPAATDLDWA